MCFWKNMVEGLAVITFLYWLAALNCFIELAKITLRLPLLKFNKLSKTYNWVEQKINTSTVWLLLILLVFGIHGSKFPDQVIFLALCCAGDPICGYLTSGFGKSFLHLTTMKLTYILSCPFWVFLLFRE